MSQHDKYLAELGAGTFGNDVVPDLTKEKPSLSGLSDTESTSPKGNYLISLIFT
jgi:hypothetical protein